MLRITVMSGARAGACFDVSSPIVRIGRAPDNDVAFDPAIDLDASGKHAEIRAEGSQWVLYDLQSRNGLFLASRNMSRVHREPLNTVEQIQFGAQGPRIQVEVLGLPALGMTAPTGHDPAKLQAAQQPPPRPTSPGPIAPTVAPPPLVGASTVTPDAPPPGFGALPPLPMVGPLDPNVPARKPMGQQTLLAHVGAMMQQHKGHSTVEIKAMVDANVQKATSRMRIIVAVLTGAVAIAVVAIVVLASRSPKDPASLRRQLEQLPMNDPKRKEIEAQLAAYSGNNEGAGHQVYEENKGAIFMLVAHRDGSFDKGGFCTAFAVKRTILASNAHCVKAATDMVEGGARIFAHLNESNDGAAKPQMFRVRRFKGHPKYKHNSSTITPDVGLFELASDTAPVSVTLAERAELKRLGTGDPLFVIGFPGRTMDETSPVATFMSSHVGRVTDHLGQHADSFDDGWLVQHEGQTTPGTSGSPIFDGERHVVAINAGGLLESNHEAVYKYAMRIDLIDEVKLGDDDGDDDDDDAPAKKKKKKRGEDE